MPTQRSQVPERRADHAGDMEAAEEDEEENDGWGPSLHNDNRGIKMTVNFTPIPPPLEAGKKRRANAKTAVVTKIGYFHEDMGLNKFLVKVVALFKREDLLERSRLFNRETFDDDVPDSFTAKYTVPRKVKDAVQLNNPADFNQMVHEATSQKSAEIKLSIVEHRTVFEDDEVGDPDDEDERGSRKKSKATASEEEKAQAAIILDLERRHRCNDKQCSKTPCYVTGPEAEHIHLTHMHLRTWAAAIEGKVEGVDNENPPNSKLFDPTNKQNTDDVALLARRRLNQAREAAVPNITVNIPGLGDLFRQQLPLPPPKEPLAAQNLNLPTPAAHRLLPPMKLEDFCARYYLSESVRAKLIAIQITGPHLLRLISDVDLRGEGKLSVGELASLRDAELRWVENNV